MDGDLVKIEAFARNKAIHVTETCDEFPVLVRVTGAPCRRAEEMPCVGVDVVLAFNSPPLSFMKVLMMLVDSLSPNDRLSILFWWFSGIVHVLGLTYMSNHGRHVVRLKINELAKSHDHGRSYIGPVLPEAAQILRQRGVEESRRRPAYILHVWNGGMIPAVHNQDISPEFPVHTLGVGRHEPADMKHIADLTSGTYESHGWYDYPEKLLASFYATIAPFAPSSVRITLQAGEGVAISSIASGRYHNIVNSDKQSATVDLYSIYAGEQKTFIITLTVPQGKERLVTIGGMYQTLKTTEELVGFDVVVVRPHRKCMPHEEVIHPKVAAELLWIRFNEGIAKPNQNLSRNDVRLLLDKIKNQDEARAAPQEVVSDFLEEVSEMMDQYGVDMESMLASLNCRQLQRSTNKGTSPWVDAIQILEQDRVDEHTNMVKIQGFTRSKAIMGNETCNEFPVLVRVTAAPWRHAWEMPRDGVDIVAVIDINTNMQAGTLELVKQSMMIVIDKLGPDDRLSIVSLQTHKRHLMELTYMSHDHGLGRDAARFKITQLKASSGNYMGHIASTALEEGAQILRGRGEEESNNRQGCIILLSDGEYPEILQIKINPEIPVHTFGLGVDHNPKVMKYIADMTSGTYSFIDQDINNIKDALGLFITGLTSIAASSIMITLETPKDITISSIESGNYIHHVKPNQMSGKIIIEHIYAGEQKDFIVNLTVGRGAKKLMTIGGEFKAFKWNKSIAEMDMSVTRPWLTRSPEDLTIQPDVAAEVTRIRLQNGVLGMVEAQKMTTQELQKLWTKIKHSDEGRSAPEEILSSLSIEVAEMNRDISGMPYTLSWLSCHKWQRATSKGMPNNSRAFRTIGQYADDDTNLVKVETFTRSKAIPNDDPYNMFPVLVRVMAEPRLKAEEMLHPYVDVVAVLDASAGMQGKKLERMKDAMMVVIGKLRAKDRLSIVSFNTYENRLTRLTYMTEHGRDVARLKISQLVADGQGDVVAALREGTEILRWREAESSHRVGCMVFLSDCKNYEILETEIRPKFPVHTFGLGTDHNPSMMKYIADITSGTYSFVNQDVGMTKDALALFITNLTSVVAMSIKITLRTNEGITMSSIESGGYVNYVENNQLGMIDINNIYAGEWKDFIVYLRVAEGKKELMTIGGQYLSHNTVKHIAYTDVCVQRPHQEGLPEDLGIQPDVAAALVQIKMEKGISTLVENSPSIAGLRQLWEEIVDTEEARGMQAETLSGLSVDVAEMKRDIENPKEYSKSGLPYMLSWLSSRKWQRATIKGTPSSSDAFQTTWQDEDGRATLSQ
ncbi:hypothetical protein ACQ4PT_052932 [Festuca glaucescens]